MMTVSNSWQQLVKHTISDFFEDKGPRLGAALTFYTTFSIAPLLVMSAATASLFFGAEAVAGHVNHELVDFVGKDGAEGIQAMLTAATTAHRSGIASSIFGIVTLLFGAMGVFMELKDSMNTIWGVEVRRDLGIWGSIKDSAFSFVMVLGVALLLLVSMILTSLLSALGHSFADTTTRVSGESRLPPAVRDFGAFLAQSATSVQTVDFLVSSIVITLLFMFIFKYLPDAKVLWKDVWIGALVTALLFTIGKHLMGFYLAKMVVASPYGAVSSFVVFLLWMYYSSQILFLGAEFTQVYTRMRGRRIQPSSNAQEVTAAGRVPRGLVLD